MACELVERLDLLCRRHTVTLGRCLARVVQPSDLVILSGDLGAGKTFLSRSVARALGVDANVRVTSPTFTLVHIYDARLQLVHADLYRICSAADAVQLGLDEHRANGAVLLVEWGEPYVELLGGDALSIHLELAQSHRSASIRSSGPRAAALHLSLSVELHACGLPPR